MSLHQPIWQITTEKSNNGVFLRYGSNLTTYSHILTIKRILRVYFPDFTPAERIYLLLLGHLLGHVLGTEGALVTGSISQYTDVLASEGDVRNRLIGTSWCLTLGDTREY